MSRQVEDILRKLVGFDTVSHKSNRACVDFIRDYLDGFGIASTLIPGTDTNKVSLWATVGDPAARGVALAGHTDVVPVEGQDWRSDPFTLVERDGKLFGRGAVDMKGFIACALAFVPEFLASGAAGCFHLALTSDEETDMSGVRSLTDFLAERRIVPSCIWVGEPTEFALVNRHKGVSAYQTTLTGVPCHSGQSAKGVNAIELTRHLMNILEDVAQERRAMPCVDSPFDPPHTTLNFGTIQGGTAENVVAAQCSLLWELRPHPGDTAEAFRDEAERRARAAFAPYGPRARMETRQCCDTPAFFAPDNEALGAFKRVLACDAPCAVGFATEAGFYQKITPHVVICGPGSINQAHQPDEFIEKNQLSPCVDLMRRFLLSSWVPETSAFGRSMP